MDFGLHVFEKKILVEKMSPSQREFLPQNRRKAEEVVDRNPLQ